jgi:hypothetical protein
MPISECVNGCVTNDRLGLVRLANLTVTKVRQRMAREQLGHRGRKGDLAWAHRMLLLRAGDRLSARALRRLDHVFRADDIGPDQDFTPETVAAARQQVERMRMLEWEITGVHPGDTDPDTA